MTTFKRCPDCGLTKPFTEFHRKTRNKDGLQSYCKPCHAIRNTAISALNPRRHRAAHLRQRHGITIDEYDAMLEAQGGGCAICDSTESGRGDSMHVDHSHDTGTIRGLLCLGCNTALGGFKDDIKRIEKAISYLAATR